MTDEIADLNTRIAALRIASRPNEPLTANYSTGNGPTAQGHILSAITALERRRDELMMGRR